MKLYFTLLTLLIFYVFCSSANQQVKNRQSINEALRFGKYPRDIVESIHSDLPDDEPIEINFSGTEINDDDATISIDSDSEHEEDEDSTTRNKKPNDIHSFF